MLVKFGNLSGNMLNNNFLNVVTTDNEEQESKNLPLPNFRTNRAIVIIMATF